MNENKKKIALDKSTIIILVVLVVTIIVVVGIKIFQSIDFEEKYSNNGNIDTTIEVTENPTTNNTQTTIQDNSTGVQNINWKSIYKAKLIEIKNSLDNDEEYLNYGTSNYCLYDIDGNSIQELIIYSATNESNAQFEFYTYVDNKAQYLGDYYAGSSSLEIGDNGELLCNYCHMGVQQINQLTVKGDKVVGNTVYTGSDENGYINMGKEIITYDLSDFSILE